MTPSENVLTLALSGAQHRICELQQKADALQREQDEDKALDAQCYGLLQQAFDRAGVPSSSHFGCSGSHHTVSSQKVDWLAKELKEARAAAARPCRMCCAYIPQPKGAIPQMTTENKTGGGWVSCSERLPMEGDTVDVLCRVGDSCCYGGRALWLYGGWCPEDVRVSAKDITHWMLNEAREITDAMGVAFERVINKAFFDAAGVPYDDRTL